MPKPPEFRSLIAPSRRVHVPTGYMWGHFAGTDYWHLNNSGFDIYAAASTAVGEQLAENGWTATSLVNTGGSGADFRGSTFTRVVTTGPGFGNRGINGTWADIGIPNHALTNAQNDLLASPAIFGNADHSWQAARLMGANRLPDLLVCEFFASFTVVANDETKSAIGLFEDGATISTEADQYAVIRSNNVNFLLQGNAATMTTGPVIDTAWHLWKIILQFNGTTGPNVYAYMDGAIFSATPGVGAQDEFPLKFGFDADTTNRPGVGLVHIYYDWI